MAQLKNEDLVLNIIVNGNSAQSEIGRLSRAMVDNKNKINAAKAEMAQLDRQGQKNSTRYRQLEQDIVRYNNLLDASRSRLQQLRQSLRLEDQTIGDLEKSLKRLTQLRKQAMPGSDTYNRLTQQMSTVSARLAELRGQVQSTGGIMRSMQNQVTAYFNSWVSGALALGAAVSGIRKATEDFAKFDDQLSDVMKTTNLNKIGVKELNAELEKIQTRTKQEDLLGLARISGKLGYNEINDIVGFVKANNQLVVALNEDLGGNVEETVNAVGKLVDIFKLKDTLSTEQAFLKVGSAINELGMASTANEGYIVDFTKRLSGIAPLTGLTIQQVMGLGATLDSLGQSEEVSSTALSKLFVKMASNAKVYAKYAGLELTAFKDLMEKDFMAAFIRVMEGVKKNSNGINELAGTLGDLGEDGGRTIGVIGKLAENTNLLTQQINLSNQAFADGTSLTQEYNVKNENAAAKLEMARKEVEKYWRELGEKLYPILTAGINLTTIFIQIIGTIVSFIAENRKAIMLLIVAFVTYNAVTRASNALVLANIALTRLKIIWDKALTAGTILLIAAQELLAGRVRSAGLAMSLFFKTINISPIGLLITAITTLGAAIVLYGDNLRGIVKTQDALGNAMKKASDDTAAQLSEIDSLNRIMLDNKVAHDKRIAAMEQLKQIMPGVLEGYTQEELLVGKATNAINEYSKALVLNSQIQAKKDELSKLAEEERKIQKNEVGFLTDMYRTARQVVGGIGYASVKNAEDNVESLKNINTARKELTDSILSDQEKLNKMFGMKKSGSENNAPTVTPDDSKEREKALREANKARIRELEAAKIEYENKLRAEGLFQRNRNTMTAKELEKRAQLTEEYNNKQNDINAKYNHSQRELTNKDEAELDRRAGVYRKYRDKLVDKTNPEIQLEREAYEQRLKDAGLFGLKREELVDEQLKALEVIENNHQTNINKIDAEAINKKTDQLLKSSTEELSDLRIKHTDELNEISSLQQAKEVLTETWSIRGLNKIKTLDQAKKLIRNQQNLEEQAALKRHLDELLQKLELMRDSGQMDGINLSDKILSEEEKKILLAKIREIKEQIAGLTGKDLTETLQTDERSKTDILGMSIEDWEVLFTNLDASDEKLKVIAGALGSLIQVWSQYNSFVAAGENAQLQKDEQANKKKKSSLDQRLKAGTISQEAYNAQVEKLDKDMEHKKSVVAHNQAKRERNVALMSAIVNTASAVTKALPNLILAGIVGAFGGFQIATILKTPLPAIEGKEEGGYLDVTRAQDGRRFRAKSDPSKRGYVSAPTVIVGESGDEFVANNDAVRNPQVRPILDILDIAQRNGTISSLKITDIIRSTPPGRATGGYVSTSAPSTTIIQSTDNDAMLALIVESNRVNAALYEAVRNGVSVSLLGPNGFNAKQAELQRIQKNADL